MIVDFGFKSDIGSFRNNNQDAVNFIHNEFGQYFGIVCDGLGGHSGGKTASEVAVKNYCYYFQKTNFTYFNDYQVDQWFRDTTYKIQDKMAALASENAELSDMGTTVSAILIMNTKAYIINIGDSRVYQYNQGKYQQITKDHNVRNMVQDRVENTEQLLNNAGHTFWKALTSALGPNKQLRIDVFVVSNIVDLTFILTSDGVHEFLEDYDVIDILKSSNNLASKARMMVNMAIDNVSTDNLTVLIITITK